MKLDEITTELTAILSRVLKNENIELNSETTAEDIEGWDSLSNILIFKEIEEHFNIKFKLREILKFKNIGELTIGIQKKTA